MLPLDSPQWAELSHAYGAAGDIPQLLKQLTNFRRATVDKEPWFSLWSALAHQGDVYSASFAAVPHVVAAIGGGIQSELQRRIFNFRRGWRYAVIKKL
ncbi:MAG TPA: hypothetical protein VHW71_05265 [Steroidobacteraceae bacterium]|jgi:hypothetical protein|nr:hypothetical protein [Steroidobacteraceae bacterium]